MEDDGPPYLCEVCEFTTDNIHELVHHQREHIRELRAGADAARAGPRNPGRAREAGRAEHKPATQLHIANNPKVWRHQKVLHKELQEWHTELKSARRGEARTFMSALYWSTGSGKTSVLAMIPLVLNAKRTLIISPSQRTREEVYYKIVGKGDGQPGWLAQVGASDVDLESCTKELKEGKHTRINELKAFKIVVATAACINNRVSRLNEDGDAVTDFSEVLRNISVETQKMIRRGEGPMFDLIIVDESHHLGAPTWQHIKEELYSKVEWSTTEAGWRNSKRKPYLVCLTGTPTLNRSEFDDLMGLHRSGALPARVFTPYSLHNAIMEVDNRPPTIKDIVFLNVQPSAAVRRQMAQNNGRLPRAAELESRMDCVRVIAHLLSMKRCFSNVRHVALIELPKSEAEALRDAINASCLMVIEAGCEEHKAVRAEVITGDQSTSTKMTIMAQYAGMSGLHNTVDILIQDKVLTEGFDEPCVSVLGVFKDHKGDRPFEQFAGRGLRRISSGTRDDYDNTCHIVSHNNFNLDRFKEYRKNTMQLRAGDDDWDEDDVCVPSPPKKLRGVEVPYPPVDTTRKIKLYRYLFPTPRARHVRRDEDNLFISETKWSVTDKTHELGEPSQFIAPVTP